MTLVQISSGTACEIFDLGDGKVMKAFFDINLEASPRADPTWAPRVHYAAELDAYRSLQHHPDLELYVPQFFGEVDPRAFDLGSKRTFSTGCGLILEKIPGIALKFYELPPEVLTQVEDVVERIKDCVGVDDPWDGSCFIPGTRAAFTIIDFATPTERLVALDSILARHGTVPPEFLAGLGLR